MIKVRSLLQGATYFAFSIYYLQLSTIFHLSRLAPFGNVPPTIRTVILHKYINRAFFNWYFIVYFPTTRNSKHCLCYCVTKRELCIFNQLQRSIFRHLLWVRWIRFLQKSTKVTIISFLHAQYLHYCWLVLSLRYYTETQLTLIFIGNQSSAKTKRTHWVIVPANINRWVGLRYVLSRFFIRQYVMFGLSFFVFVHSFTVLCNGWLRLRLSDLRARFSCFV